MKWGSVPTKVRNIKKENAAGEEEIILVTVAVIEVGQDADDSLNLHHASLVQDADPNIRAGSLR